MSTLAQSSKTDEIFDQYCNFGGRSSALSEAWYSTDTASLVVSPTAGGFYRYLNVSETDWDQLVYSPSPGSAWADIRRIYGHSYPMNERPEYQPHEARNAWLDVQNEYEVTVSVSGAFAVTVSAADFRDALREVEDDLNEKFEGLGLSYEIVEVSKK